MTRCLFPIHSAETADSNNYNRLHSDPSADHKPVAVGGGQSRTLYAQGYLAGWTEGAWLAKYYREGFRTAAPQFLQALVVELTEVAMWRRNPGPFGEGYDEGEVAAYDAAFGAGGAL